MLEILSVLTLAAALAALTLLLLNKQAAPLDVSGVQVRLEVLEKSLDRLEKAMREESAVAREQAAVQSQRVREESAAESKRVREEVAGALKGFNDSVLKQIAEISSLSSVQIAKLMESNETRQDALRTTVEERLKALQAENTLKLDQMRQTVDEKLQGTLEKRLGDSFKLVSERLEQVHKGLGEMQALATGVGDLKKVLTNVKTRGTWGEVQLGNLLEQLLTRDQYEQNVATTGTGERVEYAIKLPGKSDSEGVVWLPIDAKFPQEDYARVVEASERGDLEAVEFASRQLELRVKSCAQDISRKYLCPPKTTDFGILFLPTESLYAEVLRRPGLAESIQRDFRVTVAGPTTLSALLNSLQMGFRTLAIQKRSSEVWEVLGAVKTEFRKYGEILDKVSKKLQEASNTVDSAAVRSRAIERKLKSVEAMPESRAAELLGSEEEVEFEQLV